MVSFVSHCNRQNSAKGERDMWYNRLSAGKAYVENSNCIWHWKADFLVDLCSLPCTLHLSTLHLCHEVHVFFHFADMTCSIQGHISNKFSRWPPHLADYTAAVKKLFLSRFFKQTELDDPIRGNVCLRLKVSHRTHQDYIFIRYTLVFTCISRSLSSGPASELMPYYNVRTGVYCVYQWRCNHETCETLFRSTLNIVFHLFRFENLVVRAWEWRFPPPPLLKNT